MNRNEIRIASLCLPWESRGGADSISYIFELLRRAGALGVDVVCLPEGCLPPEVGVTSRDFLARLGAIASDNSMYIVANLEERDSNDRVSSISWLLDRDGRPIGMYQKSHSLPYENISLGNELPVFETDFGRIGLKIGSDHYFPEIDQVLAMKGARMIFWSHRPEPVREGSRIIMKHRARAIDTDCYIICSGYASEFPYMTNNLDLGGCGTPWGHSCIIDPSGCVIASTGYREGLALAVVDLEYRKKDVSLGRAKLKGQDIYSLSFIGSRDIFGDIGRRDFNVPWNRTEGSITGGLIPLEATKRKVRIGIAHLSYDSCRLDNRAKAERFVSLLDQAGEAKADVIVYGEGSHHIDQPLVKESIELISQGAKKNRLYVVVGAFKGDGLRDSVAYLWDRSGEIIGRYQISQYGESAGLPVFGTDFGTIGIRLCGDIYSWEIDRVMALNGAEIIFCPSQSWAANGEINQLLAAGRAIDNGIHIVQAHFPTSDPSLRSFVMDPYGYPVAASHYWSEELVIADVDLDARGVWFEPDGEERRRSLVPYYKEYPQVSERGVRARKDFVHMIFSRRRPELYGIITEDRHADPKGEGRVP